MSNNNNNNQNVSTNNSQETTNTTGNASSNSGMELRVGKHFRIGRKIGNGSFGSIYSGTNVLKDEKVAIKLVIISFASFEATFHFYNC